MSKIYKLSFALLLMLSSMVSLAQNSFFADASEAQARSNGGKRVIVPLKYRTVSLDKAAMKSFLWSLPSEKSVANRKAAPILSLPMPDGSLARFNVWESSIQEKGLEEKFPEIRTFAGQCIEDPYKSIRFDYNPYTGFHAQILSSVSGRIYFDSYTQLNTQYYIVYDHADNRRNPGFSCAVDQANPTALSRPENTEAGPCRGTQLTTYRFALTCTGEYANVVSGGVANAALTHAAIVTTTNRVSGVYEVELSIRLVLVANNNLVEFLDPAGDPFANDGSIAELNLITSVINAQIGQGNYDVGHLACTASNAGVAGLGVVCTGSKGRGLTGGLNPVGDGYDIDYVAHEIGHQFAGQHTFNSAQCASPGASYEPGSGTTIMAYAGICAATENIAPNSDAIFHAKSFDDASNFLAFGSGGSCGVNTPTNNNLPVIATLPNNNINIPINTPFVLTGSATDADGDAISYNWEGWDVGAAGTWPSAATSTTRPLFRTRLSSTSGSRTFPDIRIIAANYPGVGAPSVMNGLRGEVLPQVARTMKFRLTVRDNRAGGGGVVSAGDGCQDPTLFNVNAVGTTPFAITVPNGGESYFAGSTQTVTWNNAATNAAPFNVPNVRITFSNDGGLTYPTTLLATTANDGSEAVVMPAFTSTTARVRVEAIGNIFFDISNANFTLTIPPTDFNFGTTTTTTSACPATATLTVTIPTTQLGGFSNPITVTTTAGVPTGTTVTFAPNPVTPGSSTIATLNNANILAAGNYAITVQGTASGASTKTTTINFTITAGAGPIITTNAASTAVCAPNTASFSVATAATGVTYQWQVAQAATPTVFANITGATSAGFTTGATSVAMNGNVYRCILTTQCGTTTSAAAILTVNTAAAITTQPTNQTACTGGTATFTAAATGAGVTYQWQSALVAAGPWTNVGTNSPNYTTAPLILTTPTFYRVIVTTTICPGTVTSNTATLGISATTAIGTQPTAQVVCAPNTATFSVAATGTGISYQWQVATAAAPTTFTNVGTNSPSFTTPATMASMSGNIYRVVVTGSCNAVTSSEATLTVNTAATITSIVSNPTNATVCNGETIAFTSVASGTGITYQWQVAQAATPTVFTNITGATSANFTTIPTTPSMNGNLYRLVATTTTCPAVINSTAIAITVNTVAIIGTQPTAQQACIPQTATFSVAATGTGLSYQWQVAQAATPTVFTNIAGATSATYTTGATALTMNGSLYRVSILSTCSPTTPTISNAALLTVTNPVAITAQPTNLRGCIGDNFTFTSTATSPGNNITFQWQASATGTAGSYSNIAGATGTLVSTANATFTITAAPAFLNGRFYRVFYSVACGAGVSSDTSAAATLNISIKPTVTITAPPTSATNAAVNQGIFTTISPATSAVNFMWTKNGTPIPNTNSASFITLPVDGNGTYQVKLIDAGTGCEAASNLIVITQADNIAQGQLFVYPNPVRNQMDVRFNYPNLNTTNATLVVYDEKGARVFVKSFAVNNTFGRMKVDMSNFRPATYVVYVIDASGKRLAGTKVVKVP